MKIRYKFIHFVIVVDAWVCFTNRGDNVLGTLEYHKQWKQWVFQPEACCEFSMDCLEDIIAFTKQL